MPYFKEKFRKVIDRKFIEIKSSIYTKIDGLDITIWKTKEPVTYSQRMIGEKLNVKKGDVWGELWDCAWFNFKGVVPSSAKGSSVVLIIDFSGEGLIYDDLGVPLRGLTTVASTFDATLGIPGKRIYKISQCSDGLEAIDIWVDAGCNDLFGNMVHGGTIIDADIAVCNEPLRKLFYDFQVLINLMDALDKNSARANRILFKLYEASNELISFDEKTINKAQSIITPELNKKGGDASLKFTAIGHAHIDLAWLWPIRETKRKGARTFSTAIDLMNRYPDYKFGASQPQLYEWIKQDHPVLYQKIKEKVKAGQWELQGAMWVEADTNLISGESLVRQLLYGKKFYREEFGKEIDCLWLPDVFGYSGALPQILKKSNVQYFMTQKLSWNDHNKFPHHTFMWIGIDGSEVLTHMLAENTYNSSLSPKIIHDGEMNYMDSGVCDEALSLFGIGDGGGGPGPEHIERAIRMKNLNGIPPVEMGFSENFFHRLEAVKPNLKKWVGELYLERHQGTYTTQAKNKKYNRKLEFALRELEFALVLSNSFEDYPKNEMDNIWKEILLYQFHDIIPGSSIKRVYDESLVRYETIEKQIRQMTDNAYELIASTRTNMTAFNSLSWDRETWYFDKSTNDYYYAKLPSMGYGCLEKLVNPEFEIGTNESGIFNKYIDVKFNIDGSVSNIYDKTNKREVLSVDSKSNVMELYEDKGDCWDIDITYLDVAPNYFKLKSMDFLIEGFESICRQTYVYNKSTIQQDIVLSHNSKKVEFRTKVSWNEDLLMLRTSFITNIKSEFASYEIQFGEIKRSTHENTSWDLAQFESCAHKWVDLSQPDYGVALLNDCKYGHRIDGHKIDINLLRAQNYPGINADRGDHEFMYAIYPHLGTECTGDVSRQAYELNVPVGIYRGNGADNASQSFMTVDNDVKADTIKRAEDSNDIIIRLFEPYGKTTKTNIKFNKKYKNIYMTDLMENIISKMVENSDTLSYELKPFEIVTLRLNN